MKNFILVAFLLHSLACFSQKPDSVKTEANLKIYHASATKINDLVHTKLDVSFDYSKSWMYGKALITLHPHFYATDSLNLDAKCMKINEVSMIKSGKHIPLKYTYDSLNLRINLDKSYPGGENYTVFIDYIAKPDENISKGSAVIRGAKGLYFINPLGKDKNKPTQIWTQGETESNSGWFPTIDKPNQKTTEEISMTVPDKYQTLSNGLLVSQKKNIDGTRTDTWKMDLPHAPYLVMMAIGEFSIVKDKYKGKEVNYYVEKEYAPVARKIFGLTPEMMGYFSQLTGVEYPWAKYAQIIGRDFISGAMENTTATLHSEWAQQDVRQLIDGNSWERTIAHELFHQWFGDYVTTESWSNMTINESFADYSEVLWYEYKYGKETSDEHNYDAMQIYMNGGNEDKNLVRFNYRNQEEMLDQVSYQKGGRILNMLRSQVGDSAFFKSINLFLTTKKFQSAEAQELRLAFEEVTGQDLNWFWNQWYYGSGHPKLDISYDYNPENKTAKVIINQTQPDKIFKFQIGVDVYQGAEKKRYQVWIDQKADTLTFPASSKPDLINVDGDKSLLCDKNDHKSLDNFIFQYHHAGLYVDKREAIYFASGQTNTEALDLMKTAMKDNYQGMRMYTIRHLNIANDTVKNAVESQLADLAYHDPKSLVRAQAIEFLGKYKKEVYKDFFLESINDSSYSVAGNALIALAAIDSTSALTHAKAMASLEVKGSLLEAINNTLFNYATESEFDSIAARFENFPFGFAKYFLIESFGNYLKRVKETDDFKHGLDLIVSFRNAVPEQYYLQYVVPYLNERIIKGIAEQKQKEGLTEQANYANSKLPAEQKGPEKPEVH
jgi:aminopeptidase N